MIQTLRVLPTLKIVVSDFLLKVLLRVPIFAKKSLSVPIYGVFVLESHPIKVKIGRLTLHFIIKNIIHGSNLYFQNLSPLARNLLNKSINFTQIKHFFFQDFFSLFKVTLYKKTQTLFQKKKLRLDCIKYKLYCISPLQSLLLQIRTKAFSRFFLFFLSLSQV